MKYNININQLVLQEYQELDVVDGAILDFLHHICSSTDPSIVSARINEDGKCWTWVNLYHLLSEMPLLRMKSTSALSARLTKIRDAGFVDSIRKIHQRLFICLTPEFDKLFVTTHSPEEAIRLDEQSYSFKRTNNNISDNNKEKKKSTSSSRKVTETNASNETLDTPNSPAVSAKRLANTIGFLVNLPEESIKKYQERFAFLTREQIIEEADIAHAWILSKGYERKYKNYEMFLMNWLRKKNIEENSQRLAVG